MEDNQVLDEVKKIGASIEQKSKEQSDSVKTELKKEITETSEAIKKEVKEKTEEIEGKIKTLSEQADSLEAAQKMTSLEKETKGENIHAAIEKQLKAQADALISLQKDKSAAVKFDVKAAGTITISGHYSGGIVGLSSWDPEFARIQRRKPFLRELVRVIPMSSQYVSWAEQANPDPGVAGTVNEAAEKPQTDFDIVERNSQARKIAVYIKVSKEALADIPYLQGEINTELMELVKLKLDEQILEGDDNAPNLRGILDVAPAFNAGSLAGTIPSANRFDVIRAAVAQIAAANFTATHVLINPVDAASMELTKDDMGRYLLPPFQSADGTRIAGLEVVENNGVDAGTFLVGDMKKDTLAVREELNIQIGYVDKDFINNLVTILAETRAANYVKTNHFGAFVQGTFADAIADLELAEA